ncbi:uncharacterized protein B0H18DRAFT_1209596 [Fomitopsis serialis]|uniref:uncharacterized protein n=1 Tax=Fomitopsis serialis TaxID=139415 RepID=UPI002008600A|nr:uncharacterized protein B0H18DRAFT_1209596 [Neoantrodia serialis]KAH9930100.1 hypothetical protein B0H18DRAFT_1209596 [Neoantrodia serialis]
MSPRRSRSSSSRTGESSTSPSSSTPSLAHDMYGTPRIQKSNVSITQKKQTLQSSEVNKESWAAEIDGKISLFDEDIKDFFDVYVPFDNPFGGSRPWSDPAAVFADVPSSGPETARYPAQIKALESIVGEFEYQRKPLFANGSRCSVKFPFPKWEEEHHYTMPDILMSFPGEDDDTGGRTWQSISMVFEIKPGKHEDPFGDYGLKHGKLATGVLTQIAKSARNIMLTHGMLFVYIVGIYDSMARIYRFDHAAGVASQAFDIKKDPWPLHELIWRFCHQRARAGGLAGAPFTDMVLGADPSLRRVTDEDIKLVDEECSRTGRDRLTEDEKEACRWMTVIRYNEDGLEVGATRYLLYRLRFLNPRLFSRSTMVWDALEEGTWQLCAIKEAWRQLARDREDVLYGHIRDAFSNRPWWEMIEDYVFMHCNDEPELEEMVVAASLDIGVTELYGLPDVVYGEDLGAREAAKVLSSLGSSSGSDSEVSDADLDLVASSADRPPAYDVYHRTVCAWLRGSKKAKYNERSHMRLVMRTVGRPLSSFKSTKEVVRTLRDAIHGHRQAYLAGTIHRDISEGNVMIVDDWMCFFVGFLLDLDYGFDWKSALKHAGLPVSEASWKEFVDVYNKNLPHLERPAPPEIDTPILGPGKEDNLGQDNKETREKWEARMRMKERTGTLYFMAIEILETYVAHDVRHDLESFFWLLLWVVLRYTNHTSCPPYHVFISVFGAQDAEDSAAKKARFLSRSMNWGIKDNAPLTTLVRKFKILCYKNMPTYVDPSKIVVPLTYESVLALFDEALADPSWPENDHALPFKLPNDSDTSKSKHESAAAGGPSGDESRTSNEGRKRTREAEQRKGANNVRPDPWAMPPPAPKRVQTGRPSPLRFEVSDSGEEN